MLRILPQTDPTPRRQASKASWTVTVGEPTSTQFHVAFYFSTLARSVPSPLSFLIGLKMFRAMVIDPTIVPYGCNPMAVARRLRTGMWKSCMAHGAVALGLVLLSPGCASEVSTSRAAQVPVPEYRELRVDHLVVTAGESLSAFELLQRGKNALDRGDAPAAARDLDLVVEQDPRGPWTEEALYVGARAHEESGDHLGAAQRFARVAREFPKGEFTRDAYVRAVRVFVFLEQWDTAGRLSHAFVEKYRERLPREEVVVQSAIALAELARAGQSALARTKAQVPLMRARSVIERYRLDGAGDIPRDLAQVYFAKGELLRLEGESVGFDPLPGDFADQFERRAQLLLDAQSAYSDVMRAYDAHWTAMAGFRVGELYQRLHRDVMSAPRPVGADTERRKLAFEAALRLRYSVLLKKGLNMMEHTLAMAERTGESSAWVSRARQARDEIKAAYAVEQAAVDACPYSKEDLERVLAEIARRQPPK